MLFSALAAGLAALHAAPAFARVNQIPHVNGVHGGDPTLGSPEQLVDVTSARNVTGAASSDALRVTENSGICETTPGVYQASGYGNVSSTGSLWCVISKLYITCQGFLTHTDMQVLVLRSTQQPRHGSVHHLVERWSEYPPYAPAEIP